MQTETETINITLLEGHTGVAYAFWDGQLVVGLGARGANLDLTLPDAPEDEQELIHFTDAGLEAGLLLRLGDQPWRIGVAGRLPVEAKAETEDNVVVDPVTGVKSIRGFILPKRVYMPWEVQLGFAWQFGDRRFNEKWEEPRDMEEELEEKVKFRRCWRMEEQLRIEAEKKGQPLPEKELCPDLDDEPEDEAWWEREEKIREEEDEQLDRAIDEEEDRIYWARRRYFESDSRRYWLVSAELLLIGSTNQGVGMDAFLEQVHREAGKDVSVGFRIGAETEPIPTRLKVRAGFYLEPPRIVSAHHRPHGTVGFDVRLFRWDVWGLFNPFDLTIGMTGDFAPRYIDLGIGVGFWH
jgi:hypothetical protein